MYAHGADVECHVGYWVGWRSMGMDVGVRLMKRLGNLACVYRGCSGLDDIASLTCTTAEDGVSRTKCSCYSHMGCLGMSEARG